MRGERAVGLGRNRALVEAAFGVLARVDKVRVVQRQFDGTVYDVVSGLNTEHKRVVLVANLVPPATEPTSGVDTEVLELRKKLGQNTLTLQRWRGVAVVELAVVGRDNLVLRLNHVGVDQTLNAVLEEVGLVNRLHTRLGNFQHDRPVRACLSLTAASLAAISEGERRKLSISLRLVVWGVVGEDGGTVKGAVVFREVELNRQLATNRETVVIEVTYPALVTDALRPLASQTNTNNVGRRVKEILAERDELLVAHGLDQLVNSHGRNQLLVTNGGTVAQANDLLGGVDLGDLSLLAKSLLLIRESVGNGNPDTTGTIASGEAEGSVGAPVTGNLAEDGVLDSCLDIRSSYTLTEPLALHL